MSDFSKFDRACMSRALELAAQGAWTARPNPMVGCVIARDGVVLGEGHHVRAGEAHAEINALGKAGDASGATAYVTLEPCNHHGRTEPCTEALVAAGIAAVVFAMRDPNPGVDGGGRDRLREAGIVVREGLMADEARELNAGFVSRVTRGRPWVRVKVAASLDGATAMRSGASQWITGPEARADVHRLRAASGAVLTGIGTVVADDPSLTARDVPTATGWEQPLRAIVDTNLRMPLSARMLCLPGKTVVYCLQDENREALESEGAEVVRIGGNGPRVALDKVLEDLARREINDLLVEAGPVLAGSLLVAGLVDELVIYQAPHIMGSETRRMFATPGWQELSDRLELQVLDSRPVGADTRLTARIRK
jgi:diaminohydroxyphosphoribosylaminopyrimidine deaminase/5-amino-6-(5-phosphoribosylamino)uracil reductase